ncbi:MAG: hypothetical protein ACOH5I_12025 [Oligoflexus sp.]
MNIRTWIVIFPIVLSLSFACGKKKKQTAAIPDTSVIESLGKLGVDMTASPRKNATGDDLPNNYSPLGAKKYLKKFSELLLVDISNYGETSHSAIHKYSYNPAENFGSAEALWVSAQDDWRSASAKGVVAADINGDSLEEAVFTYVTNNQLWIKTVASSEAEFAESPVTLLTEVSPSCLEMDAGDFTNDGKDEIVIAVCQPAGFSIYFVGMDNMQIIHTLEFDYQTVDYQRTIDLAVGNADYDAPHELSIVLNERRIANEEGLARFLLIDDAAGEYTILKDLKNISGFDGRTYNPLSAGVAMGDINGDNIDEIIIAGLTNFRAEVDDSNFKNIGYLLLALGHKEQNFEPIGARHFNFNTNVPDFENNHVYHDVIVNTLDIDGDQRHEIQVNELVFDDFYQTQDLANPWGESQTQAWKTIETRQVMEEGTAIAFSKEKISITVADLVHDGRDEILVFSPIALNVVDNNDVYGVQAWGIAPPGHPQENQFIRKMVARTARVERESSPKPFVMPINVDRDSVQIKFLEPLKEFVFTEPLLIAAIASPPCLDASIQNIQSCTTSFGQTDSSTVENESATTVSASIHVGFNVEDRIFSQSALEVEATVTTAATFSQTSAYTLSESITYTTGPLEDGVIFTTVPFDRYIYEIASHPEADLVGQQIVVSLPRKPITLKVDRSFYNANVEEGNILVDEQVFGHTPGKLDTYPTRSKRDELLQQYGGLSTEVRSVGQGTGSVELGLGLSEEYGEGKTLEVGVELTVKLTGGGVMGGFTIGASTSSSLSVVNGTEKSYTANVGDLSADSFPGNQYNFGMFTYFQPHSSGQKFEVLNFWVER